MYLIDVVVTAIYGFIYFGMLNSLVPALMFLAIKLSWMPRDMMYGPQAALIAERKSDVGWRLLTRARQSRQDDLLGQPLDHLQDRHPLDPLLRHQPFHISAPPVDDPGAA
jgi:hypothetical protein